MTYALYKVNYRRYADMRTPCVCHCEIGQLDSMLKSNAYRIEAVARLTIWKEEELDLERLIEEVNNID